MFDSHLGLNLPRDPADDLTQALRLKQLVAIGLGSLWLVDGLLQLQRSMFTQTLVGTVANALMSLPPVLYFTSLGFLMHYISPNIAVWNLGFASLQLALGISIIFGSPRARRLALMTSIVWGALVWIFAEGMAGILGATMAGGIFPGTPSIMNGFPGAALIYAILALILLLPANRWKPSRPFSLVADIPALLFFVCAILQSAPLMWTTYGQASIFAANLQNLPSQLAVTITPLANFTAANPVPGNLIEICAISLAALGLLFRQRCGYLFALGWLAFIWWFGLGLGGTLTGFGTDPNSPPAIALLLIPAISASRSRSLGFVINERLQMPALSK